MRRPDLMKLVWLRKKIDSGAARHIRERLHISLREAAVACDIPHTTLWRWEKGERIPRADAALRYAEFLMELEEA